MKTVLITGASRGIGKATAEKFLREGWHVIGTSTSGKASLSHDNFQVYRLDISDSKSIKSFVAEVKNEKIDVLVNNAGIALEINSFSVDGLRKTLEVNLIGLIDLTQSLLPKIRDRGHIINISSSLSSLTEFNGYYHPAYQISKAALNMYTRTLASMLENRKIIVASVDPGWVKTDMGGKGANRSPEEPATEIYELANKKIDSGYFWHKGKKRNW